MVIGDFRGLVKKGARVAPQLYLLIRIYRSSQRSHSDEKMCV